MFYINYIIYDIFQSDVMECEMEQGEWTIEFYEKETGRCPTQEFLDTLSEEELVFIENAFKRLRKHGNQLKRPYIDILKNGIWELRVQTHHARYRFLFFFYHGNMIIVTHGIVKKSQKVPSSEIEKAIEFKKHYLTTHK